MLAGLTTFLTMSYIVIVNPSILVGFSKEKPGILIERYSVAEVQQMLAVVTILIMPLTYSIAYDIAGASTPISS